MDGILDDNGLLDDAKPQAFDAQNLSYWKKDVAKVRIKILEEVHDHIISNLYGKETLFAMWNTMIEFFKNSSDDKKLTLKDEL